MSPTPATRSCGAWALAWVAATAGACQRDAAEGVQRPATAQRDVALEASDAAIFAKLQQVPVGGEIVLADEGPLDQESWRDAGFVGLGAGDVYRREVDLLSPPPALVRTELEELPGVDCIAIISIDRHNGQRPYIYHTLASIFAAFPAGVQVNVLVGNSDDAYLSPARLGAEIGGEHLEQVHVLPTSPEVAAYLRDQLPANRRGGWNYTRALRGHRGPGGLILMEDDVEWGHGGPAAFGQWLRQAQRPAVSLYNARPRQVAGLGDADLHELAQLPGLRIYDQAMLQADGQRAHWFACLQGMYYAADISGALGRYVQLRMHTWVYDNIIGEFFAAHALTIGYAFPSMVQHIGRTSSCQSHEFTSAEYYRARY